MKKILFVLSLFVVCQYNLFAGYDKLDADLRMLRLSLHSKNNEISLSESVRFHSNVVDVFIKTSSISSVNEVITTNKGIVLGTYGVSIISARIPHSLIEVLHEMPEVLKMESAKVVSLNNTKAKQHVGVDKVHNGQNPLPRAFTGKGVLVGILDTGIDFLHKDFFKKDDPTKTRIIGIYDTGLNTGTPPFGLPYGKYFTKDEIQATIDGTSTVATETKDVNGHGTHVASTAAGLTGMAPDAEIVVVKTLNRYNNNNIYSTLSSEILVSMRFAAEIAKLEKKPLVYNMSLGITQGIRDGSDIASQALDELLAENPLTICVVAAANDGDEMLHWGGNLIQNGDSKVYLHSFGFSQNNISKSSFTLRIPIEDTATCSFELNPISIQNELSIFQIIGFAPLGNFIMNQQTYPATERIKLTDLMENEMEFRSFKLPNRNSIDCSYFITATVHDHVVEVTFEILDNVITASSASYMNFDLFQFGINGSVRTHLFKNDGFGGFIANPAQKGLPQQNGFIEADYIMNIGTFPTLSKNVITVGAYSNMLLFTNNSGAISSVGGMEVPEGQIAPFSSRGPSADGRVKPDIIAPGHNIASAKSRYSDPDEDNLMPDADYIANSGTSMSSPVVCGAIALLYEQNPNLTVEDVRALLVKTADKDEFTGTVPNPTWGWGKLNVFAAMQRLIVSVAEQNISSSLKVFPSVTNTNFVVSTENAEESNEVFLVNTLGETVVYKNADKLQLQHCDFNVAGVPSGQYYVVVKNKKGVQSQPIQIVK